jgi:hypothetical protein
MNVSGLTPQVTADIVLERQHSKDSGRRPRTGLGCRWIRRLGVRISSGALITSDDASVRNQMGRVVFFVWADTSWGSGS